jgi:enamine deaminase RidA (YjgF/YER057c/UK114 family)
MAQDIDKRLAELGITLPELPKPKFSYVPGVVSGKMIYVSGQTPTKDGELLFRGKLGRELRIEDGYQAARRAAINCVAELKLVLGDLNRIRRLVQLSGYVASADGFSQQPAVVNGASDLMLEIWGENGRHARKALGVNELPDGAPVEIELIAELV